MVLPILSLLEVQEMEPAPPNQARSVSPSPEASRNPPCADDSAIPMDDQQQELSGMDCLLPARLR